MGNIVFFSALGCAVVLVIIRQTCFRRDKSRNKTVNNSIVLGDQYNTTINNGMKASEESLKTKILKGIVDFSTLVSCLVAIATFIFQVNTAFSHDGPPNVEGKSKDEAVEIIKTAGYDCECVDAFSDDVPMGNVVKQTNYKINGKDSVRLFVNVKVPVQSPIVSSIPVSSTPTSIPTPVAQTPSPTPPSASPSPPASTPTPAPPKTTSSTSSATKAASTTFQMPNWVGKTETAIDSEKAKYNIIVNKTWKFNYDNVPFGTVISQSIAPGQTVSNGSTVTVCISKGEDEWKTSETAPDISKYFVEEIHQYRSKNIRRMVDTVRPATPSGYTYDSEKATGQYTDWTKTSGDNANPIDATDTQKSEQYVIYRYYCYTCPNGHRYPYRSINCPSCGNWISDTFTEYWQGVSGEDNSPASYDSRKKYCLIDGNRWYYEAPNTSNGLADGTTGQPNKVRYNYLSRQPFIEYKYMETDWSQWSESKAEPSNDLLVDTRILYRYRAKES